jgi:hypothetical protein
MQKAVALTENGSRLIGQYDGYGRIDTGDYDESGIGGNVALWHHACWEHAGKPDFDKPSTNADDQGYFTGPEISMFPPNTDKKPEEIVENYTRQALDYLEAAGTVFDTIGITEPNKAWHADLVGTLKARVEEWNIQHKVRYEMERAKREEDRGEASN